MPTRLVGCAAGEGGELITVHSMSEAKGPPLRILVVDDNAPQSADPPSFILTRAGHEAVEAASGREALSLLAERGLGYLILMDVQMPEMDGLRRPGGSGRWPIRPWPACRRRRHGQCLTGRRGALSAAGMNGYVTKPLDGAGLIATVERSDGRAAAPSGPGVRRANQNR